MQKRSRLLVIIGLVGMVIGALDPIEGAFLILPASGVAALGGGLARTRHRRLLYWACGLVAVGLGVMIVFTALGGIGGRSGRSMWWGLLLLPYPVGWILGIAGSILSLRDIRRGPAPMTAGENAGIAG